MPIRYKHNQYRGINAHLNSDLQNRTGAWGGFHSFYLVALAVEIQKQLEEHYSDQYLVDLTQSIQSVESDGKPLAAIAICGVKDENIGDPVTWLEVLSPTTKRGDDLVKYKSKRTETMAADVSLIEFDYLHQTPSVIDGVPKYPHEQNAYPYTIAISDRRWGTPQYGKVYVYGWHVDEPIREIYIPLSGDALIRFDPNSSYDRVYEQLPALSYRLNYEEPPERFNTYSPDDQTRIHQRMRAIQSSENTPVEPIE